MMLKVGSKVRVKQNAYEGSDDPDDFLARGKVGEIVFSFGNGTWEVVTEDGEYYPLSTDEVEELEAGKGNV
jgi:hypothetical protein